MKHVSEILAELGFNKDAPLETQKAFLKHLVKAAEAPKRPALVEDGTLNPKSLPAQLSLFDLIPPTNDLTWQKSNKRSA